MKPRPRIRKTAKWVSTLTALVLLAVIVASGWCGWSWGGTSGRYFSVGGGRMGMGHCYPGESTPAVPFGYQWWTVRSPRFSNDFHWFSMRGVKSWELGFPLWWVLLPLVLGTAGAWWLDVLARRGPRDPCLACGYDRAGLAATSRCPECGASPADGASNEPRTQ